MYGAILGDMIGQPYEFAGIKTTDFPLLGRDNRYTDDSVMTVAVADALLSAEEGEGDAAIEKRLIRSLQKFGNDHIDAGYGGRFFRWLQSPDPKPYHSFGNGSAMRVSAVGWLYPEDLEKTLHRAALSAAITHDHPEGIRAAKAAAAAIWLANDGESKDGIHDYMDRHYYAVDLTCGQIRPSYSFDVTAQGTMPAALAAFYDSSNFEDAVRLGVSLGGDSDTIGAITGAIAEAFYGIPHRLKKACRERLPEDMLAVLDRFEERLIQMQPVNITPKDRGRKRDSFL